MTKMSACRVERGAHASLAAGNWPSNWPAENFARVMRDVAGLREHFEPLGCTVSTSILIRKPFPQYLSFFNYYIRKHQTASAGADVNRRQGRGGGWRESRENGGTVCRARVMCSELQTLNSEP